jgi:hypothetical protein
MTTLLATGLGAVALMPIAVLVQYLLDDAAEAKDLRRLTRNLPPPRWDLAELPVRQSPSDLPARWDTAGLAAVELGSRARHACAMVAETALDYRPLHLRLDITQEFKRIVATEFGAQRCDSCTVGWPGEPQHVSCPGCSCPCTVVALPAGVEGHAIAGRTR